MSTFLFHRRVSLCKKRIDINLLTAYYKREKALLNMAALMKEASKKSQSPIKTDDSMMRGWL